MPYDSCNDRRVRERKSLHHQDGKNQVARNNASSNYQLKHAAKEYCSTETSVLKRATHLHIPETSILHSHFGENLKFYKGKLS
jgi:hypothetical protein